jgi:hypothetical protein
MISKTAAARNGGHLAFFVWEGGVVFEQFLYVTLS